MEKLIKQNTTMIEFKILQNYASAVYEAWFGNMDLNGK